MIPVPLLDFRPDLGGLRTGRDEGSDGDVVVELAVVVGGEVVDEHELAEGDSGCEQEEDVPEVRPRKAMCETREFSHLWRNIIQWKAIVLLLCDMMLLCLK